MFERVGIRKSSKAFSFIFLGIALLFAGFRSYGQQISGELVGFCMPDPVNYYTNSDDVVKEFAAAKNTGAKWVRVETYWSEIAPTQPTNQTDPNSSAYKWTTPDLFFNTAKANGQYIIWIVRGAPAWASAVSGVGNHDTAPMDTITYGNFCQALTLKYLPQAKAAGLKMAVEFWNEPNMGRAWLPWGTNGSSRQTQSTEFANRVIKPGFRGIRAAIKQLGSQYNATEVSILAGGLAGAVPSSGQTTTPDEYASYWYRAGVKGYFDAISDHPYAFNNNIPAGINDIYKSYGFDRLRALRQVMTNNADADKKIWCTEIGWPTQNLADTMIRRLIPESKLPNCIDWALDAWFSYDYAGPLIWFNCRDIETNNVKNENCGFGIVHTDWSLKQGYNTFKGRIKSGMTPTSGFMIGGKVNGDMMGFACTSLQYGYTANDIDRDFKLMTDAGAKWVRCECLWNRIEPNKGTPNWTIPDLQFNIAKANGLSMIWIIRGTPGWASVDGNSSDDTVPKDTVVYNDFCKRLVLRYLPQAKAAGLKMVFEIWNEPNLGIAFLPYTGSGIMPEFVKRALKPGYLGVKAGAAQLGYSSDDAFVLAAGLAGAIPTTGRMVSAPDFVTGMYAAGAKGYFDALSNHPYPDYDNPDGSFNAIDKSYGYQQSDEVYRIMVANGDGNKKIWATEVGLPNQNISNRMLKRLRPESWLPECVNSMIDAWFSRPYAGPMMYSDLRDVRTNYVDDEGYCQGIVHTDFSPKAAYYTLKGRVNGSGITSPVTPSSVKDKAPTP